MTKMEILKQIEIWIKKAKKNEKVWGTTELGSYAFQKVYDLLEYGMTDDAICDGIECDE